MCSPEQDALSNPNMDEKLRGIWVGSHNVGSDMALFTFRETGILHQQGF